MIYDLIAPIYDAVNAEIDYKQWADFIEAIFRRFCPPASMPDLVLDLGCGTGKMTMELAARGYDMTGVDYSEEMLDIARQSAEAIPTKKKVLWLCQDMTALDLYGTVDAVVCCLDTLNHLTTPQALKRALHAVHLFLIPDGLFIFDINGKKTFEQTYADQVYTMEDDTSFCVWENHYDPQKKLCDFRITLFKEDGDGRYTRMEEWQTERMYSAKTMKKYLAECGFETLGVYSDFSFSDGDDSDARLYIVAKCLK